MPEFDVDKPEHVSTVLAEVVRAGGNREYFKVIGGNHVPVSEEEYKKLGGIIQKPPSNVVSDLPVGEVVSFKNIYSDEVVEAAVLEEDIMADETSLWVNESTRVNGLGVEFGKGNVVVKYKDGNISVISPSIFEQEFEKVVN